MKIKGIGINAHPEHTGGENENLERDLRFFQDVGYDYVEIPVDAVDVIRCGRLILRQMQDLKSLLNSLNLKYTVQERWILGMLIILRYRKNSFGHV